MQIIYMDESFDENEDIATLCALIVPQELHQLILDDYYSLNNIIYKKMFPDETGINCKPIVFHGCEMLCKPKDKSKNYNQFLKSKAPDDIIFVAFKGIVEIINKHNLKVVRFGYSNYKALYTSLKVEERDESGNIVKSSDEKLNATNMFYMARFFSKINNIESIIIMDGTDSKMIGMLSGMFVTARAVESKIGKNKCVINPNLFLGNVFYTNIQYSEFIQLIDCIAFLLKKKGLFSNKSSNSSFQNELQEIAKTIKQELVTEEIVEIKISN